MISNSTQTEDHVAYSVEQVSERTSLSKAYVRKEIRAGNLKAKLIGRRVVILDTSLREYLESGTDWLPPKER